MRKTMIAAALISGIALQALEQPDMPKGLLLSPQEWVDIKAGAGCKFDQIIYLNGTKYCGELVEVPTLAYRFVEIPFKIKDLSLIIFSQESNQVQYVTHEGSSFTGKIPNNPGDFKFTIDNVGIVSPQAIDLKKVRAIVLKEREARLNPISRNYIIELQNGESLSVQLDSAPIWLVSGTKEFSILPDDIIELVFSGGVFGETVKGRLGFSLLKDHYLEIHVAWANQTLRLPWENISRIRRQENISLLAPQEEAPPGHANIVLIKEPEKLFSEHSGFEILQEIAFEANPLFELEEAFASYAEIAFEGIREFEDGISSFDYTQIAFEEEPYRLDHVAITQIADALVHESMESQPIESEGHDLSPKAFELVYEEDLNQGIDNEEEIVAICSEPIQKAVKPKNEEEEEVVIAQYDGDEEEEIIIGQEDSEESEEEPDLLEAPVWDEEDPMVYVSHEIHTLGEYTTKTRTLVREHALNATIIPTETAPTMVIKIPGFYIDRNLVTNREYQKFVQDTGYKEPSHWCGGKIPEEEEDSPVVNVTFFDAQHYAAWMGKRLPNEQEWIRAAKQGIFNLDSQSLLKEWTASPAYPSEGSDHDLVVIAPMMFKQKNFSQIPHSAPREIITILNENVSNETTGFRCVNDAGE